jgi:hypothetical protein
MFDIWIYMYIHLSALEICYYLQNTLGLTGLFLTADNNKIFPCGQCKPSLLWSWFALFAIQSIHLYTWWFCRDKQMDKTTYIIYGSKSLI